MGYNTKKRLAPAEIMGQTKCVATWQEIRVIEKKCRSLKKLKSLHASVKTMEVIEVIFIISSQSNAYAATPGNVLNW